MLLIVIPVIVTLVLIICVTMCGDADSSTERT